MDGYPLATKTGHRARKKYPPLRLKIIPPRPCRNAARCPTGKHHTRRGGRGAAWGGDPWGAPAWRGQGRGNPPKRALKRPGRTQGSPLLYAESAFDTPV